MSITSVTIENFKGIKNKVKIDFKPITLLYGPNSAGKSTIIQALHYLKQIFVNGNPDADVSFAYDGNVRFGGFKNIVHNHDFNNKIKLGIEIFRKRDGLNNDWEEALRNEHIENWRHFKLISKIYAEITVSWNIEDNQTMVERYTIFIDDIKMFSIAYDIHTNRTILSYFNQDHPFFNQKISITSKGVNFFAGKMIEFERYDLSKRLNLDKRKKYNFKDAFVDIFNKYFNDSNKEYNYVFREMDYALPRNKTNDFFIEIFEISEMDYYENEAKAKEYEKVDFFKKVILKQIFSEIYVQIRNSLIDFIRIGPLREMPDRIEANQVPSQQRFITGRAAWDILYRADKAFIEKFNHWISSEDRLNTGYSAYQKNIIELDRKSLPENITLESLSGLSHNKRLVYKDSNDVEVMPQDVGFGFSQVLPVIVAALMGENETKHIYFGSKEHKKIISIEQPELHIHPRLQVELGDLFIEQSVNKEVIFLVETHSEHILLRIMRRIRETTNGTLPEGATPIRAEDVSLVYVESIETDGDRHSIIREMPLNDQGELVKAWPGGFFEEGLREVF